LIALAIGYLIYGPTQALVRRFQSADKSFTVFQKRWLFNADIKQLLDEVEHNIVNYQDRGLCYLPKP